MIEKIFGWMKLEDNQEIEEFNSVIFDTNEIKNSQSKLGFVEGSAYSIDTPMQNIIENEYPKEETIQEKVIQEEIIQNEIVQEVIDQNNTIQDHVVQEEIIPDDTFQKDLIQNGTIQDNTTKKHTVQDETIQDEADEQPLYISKRKIILGVHIQFIDIAREIVNENCIKPIPLMREFHLQKSGLDEILKQMHEANIIGQYNQILMTPQELEKFLDIYEPTLFNCQHTIFDKDIFLCMGEIIFDKGVDDVYDSMNEDEVLDYLTIMEKLKIIAYNSETNEYDIISSKEDFLKICECIPRSFSNEEYEIQDQDYQGKDFDNMSGLEFERYCGYILKKNSFSDIKITQASGDHGIDILAEKAGINYAFQCKCYSDDVGNEAVQQAHTGKSLYHMDIAVVITNRFFTQQAQEEAKQLGVKLWDRNKLLELVDCNN